MSGAFRRLTRAQGPLANRVVPTVPGAPPPQVVLGQLVTRVATANIGDLQLAPRQPASNISIAGRGVPLTDGQAQVPVRTPGPACR